MTGYLVNLLRMSRKTKDSNGENMGYKNSRGSRTVTLLISFEDVTKDIKDESHPMGKGKTLV